MRSHFAAWVIVSSPLTLSHDPSNQTIMDAIWPIISNKEVLAVSQSYAGHSGSPFKQASTTVRLASVNPAALYKDMTVEETAQVGALDTPTWQYFYKPMAWDGSKMAVLLMNHGDETVDLRLDFADVPGLASLKCKARDLWKRADLGTFSGTYTAKDVASHDSVFLLLTPA